ncbi:F0-ATPase subunit F [Schizosaccharomyces japonicus yFS275]|uniref:F0-ATPase subunit F n=1 Tax=Schizosaccharomyces japonicus (strain yFS275 / FY16936) TaxID=402676 RepID=B6JWR5_SCHJY|nr:F0-ATPase subunit F [Schizosaccharomyces japonicus yFS275]EEB05816.1 F0-ATPase subunit F [Schizosaccharomyces japonicus yFS275]
MTPFKFIPPIIANFEAVRRDPNAKTLSELGQFYSKLPKGPAPAPTYNSFMGWYSNKYFGKKASGKPVLHLIAGIFLLSYASEYYFHLRHHSAHEH